MSAQAHAAPAGARDEREARPVVRRRRANGRGRRFLRAAITVLIGSAAFLGLLAAASHVVMPKNNQAEFGQVKPKANGFRGEPAHTLDVVFLGDSEAFSSFSSLQLWGEQGITSYVSATSAQRLYYTRSMLQSVLATQSPKVVVLETNCIFAPFDLSNAVGHALQDIFPVFEYHNRWKSLRIEDFTAEVRATWTDALKGFNTTSTVKAASAESVANHMAASDEQADLPALNRWYLEDIARICREHGAKLVLMSVPSTVNWNMPRHNRIVEAARELGFDYYDLNLGDTKVDIDWSTDTRDGGDHLNIAGAQKVTAAVGALLRTVYQLPDHRGDDDYSAWSEAYGRYPALLAELG